MSTAALYIFAVVIWGSTWFAIRFQLTDVAVEWSVAYRFLLSAVVMAGVALVWRRKLALPLARQPALALLGFFNFSLNYVLVYIATGYLASGVVAIIFALLTAANAVNGRIFLGVPLTAPVVFGSLLGVAGVALLFWPEVTELSFDSGPVIGFLACLGSVVLTSWGNTLAASVQKRGVHVFQVNFWGMLYGSAATAIYALLLARPIAFDMSAGYLGSLLFLAVFGTVIAFTAYFVLLNKIGLAQAGYIGVLAPLVALAISSVFEGYQWTPLAFLGVVLCLAGNVLILKKRQPPSETQAAAAR